MVNTLEKELFFIINNLKMEGYVSFYRRYQTAFFIAITIVAVLLSFIIVFFINMKKRNLMEQRYKLAVESSNIAIWEYDIDKNNFFASDKWEEITGYKVSKNDNLKIILEKLLPDENKKIVLNYLQDHLAGITPFCECEFKLTTKCGKKKWIFIRAKAIRNAKGKALKIAGYVADITEQKLIQDKNKYLGYYDSLTDLPNRKMFQDKLDNVLKNSSENSKKGALLFIDLDNFKRVNDTLGHQCGDKLLQYVANTLKNIMGEDNTVFRLGGDEFLIIQHDIKDKNDVVKVCNKVILAFKGPFKINENLIHISVSIGIAMYPQDGTTADSLLKNSDIAMYKAKDSCKGIYKFYNRRMSYEVSRKAELEEGLRSALENNQFQLYYQPEIDCKTGRIKAMEALLRWKIGENEFVSPIEFIPVAKDTSLIVPIGKWALETACKQHKRWLNKGYDFGIISINVSKVQLQHPNFFKMVETVLHESNLPPELLEIEITENEVMQSLQSNIAALEKLRRLGIGIALDDFGTGYSSLNYLRLLPINTLKIDKFFINRIHLNSKDCSVVDGIINLSHKMNISVVAEGVEFVKQFEILRSMNCNKVEGHLFSKPMPVENIESVVYSVCKFNHM
ncbi:sensor domain-containing protein [Clostridium ljungdahlii]|uniref:Cyclic di-GMP phosphodiesterase Gmr n=1 Tax=Clostridium ljungdahlii TaxID=1538 RepID=A0A166RLA0_9CLOT|nr:EAL domain-containing protein [Clostridium ljungdahlii]OAA90900.1 Cyclic di-GMP phosphodiesterase Gmr [Clostridium ljungdahlii]